MRGRPALGILRGAFVPSPPAAVAEPRTRSRTRLETDLGSRAWLLRGSGSGAHTPVDALRSSDYGKRIGAPVQRAQLPSPVVRQARIVPAVFNRGRDPLGPIVFDEARLKRLQLPRPSAGTARISPAVLSQALLPRAQLTRAIVGRAPVLNRVEPPRLMPSRDVLTHAVRRGAAIGRRPVRPATMPKTFNPRPEPPPLAW